MLYKTKNNNIGNVLQGFSKFKYMDLSSTSRIYGSFLFGLIVEMKLYVTFKNNNNYMSHWSLLESLS